MSDESQTYRSEYEQAFQRGREHSAHRIEGLEQKLSAERALADRLANLLEDIIWDYDIVPHAGCSAALAAWKEARHE